MKTLLAILLGWFLLAAQTATAPDPATLSADAFFRDYARQLSAPADAKNADLHLAAIAVFHATNQERAKEKLPPLRWSDKLAKAAQGHAAEMAKLQYLSHDSPVPEHKTMQQRLAQAGIPLTTMEENIAMEPLLNLQGQKVTIRIDESGHETMIDPATGQPAKPHTLESLAHRLVDSWMHSPGHRANILSKNVNYLGVGLATGIGKDKWPKVWATQNFAAGVNAK